MARVKDLQMFPFGIPQGSLNLGPILSFSTETHSVSDQSFADDTQLLHSCAPHQIEENVLTLHTCISNVKAWITFNKLKLQDDKTD